MCADIEYQNGTGRHTGQWKGVEGGKWSGFGGNYHKESVPDFSQGRWLIRGRRKPGHA